MAIGLAEFLSELPAEEKSAVDSIARDKIAQEYALRELRRLRDLTQKDLAAELGISQAKVSELERRQDMLLSTLRRYVAALGGEVDIVVRLPGHEPLRLASLTDIGDGR